MKKKVHKLCLGDYFDCDYRLMAIYADEHDYRMAFLLNYHLGLQFQKSNSILQPKTKAEFSVYEYYDDGLYRDYKLITNHKLIQQKHKVDTGLFVDYESLTEKTVYYVKSYAKAKYFLKLTADDESDMFYEQFIDKLKNIPQIYTVDYIDLDSFKEHKLLQI